MTARAAVAATILLALAACGVPTDDEARVTDPAEVPFGLLDADRRARTDVERSGPTVVEVYLFAETEAALIPVARRVEDPTLMTALAELERGPTDAEAAAGLRSALDESDVIIAADVSGDTATVDLAEGFSAISGADQLVAIAQTVFTATARPGVDQVAFLLDGRPIEIPRGDGSLTSGAVSRDDYADSAFGR